MIQDKNAPEPTLLQRNIAWLMERIGSNPTAVSREIARRHGGGNNTLVRAILTGAVASPRGVTLRRLAEHFGAATGIQLSADDLELRDLQTEFGEGGHIKNGAHGPLTVSPAPVPQYGHGWHSEARRLEGARIPDLTGLPRDVPILGAALGGRGAGEFFFNGETIGYAKRPPTLAGMKNAFAIYISGDSMEPLFLQGRIAYVTPDRPPAKGDYVLVEMEPENGDPVGAAIVKQLIRQTGKGVLLRQLNPLRDLPEIPLTRVKHIYRVPRPDEWIND